MIGWLQNHIFWLANIFDEMTNRFIIEHINFNKFFDREKFLIEMNLIEIDQELAKNFPAFKLQHHVKLIILLKLY